MREYNQGFFQEPAPINTTLLINIADLFEKDMGCDVYGRGNFKLHEEAYELISKLFNTLSTTEVMVFGKMKIGEDSKRYITAPVFCDRYVEVDDAFTHLLEKALCTSKKNIKILSTDDLKTIYDLAQLRGNRIYLHSSNTNSHTLLKTQKHHSAQPQCRI